MKRFCETAIEQLDGCDIKEWAPLFVKLKIEFFYRFQNGLICSTTHGVDWFNNVLNCLNGQEWDRKEHKGLYEDNFRLLIEQGRKST